MKLFLFFLKRFIIIFIGFFSCYLMLSLITFYPFDDTYFQFTGNVVFNNIFGKFGALFSDILFCIFGCIAYIFPCITFFIFWSCLYERKCVTFFSLSYKIIGGIILLLSCCGLTEYFIDDFYYCFSGGIIGYVLKTEILYPYHDYGSIINFVLLFFFITGIILLVDVALLIQCQRVLNQFFVFCILQKNFFKNKHMYVYYCSIREKFIRIKNKFIYEIIKLDCEYLKNIKNFTRSSNICIKVFDCISKVIYKVYDFFLEFTIGFFDKFFCVLRMKNMRVMNYKKIENQVNIKKFNLTNLFYNQSRLKNQYVVNHQKYFRFLCALKKSSNSKILSNSDMVVSIKKMLTKQENADKFPNVNLLFNPVSVKKSVDLDNIKKKSKLLESRLLDYHIRARVINVLQGPILTRFELDLAPGLKSTRIVNLSRDLARALSVCHLGVTEIIPGRPYIGLDIPNSNREMVYLREVIDSEKFRSSCGFLTLCFGKDISGNPVIANLEDMPHLLIAGMTGSGKSIGINSMIVSILYKASPEDVRFIMIDPKILELSVYEGIPHLIKNVITNMEDVISVLKWCIEEMERRYKIMASCGVRNLKSYNEWISLGKGVNKFSINNYLTSNRKEMYEYSNSVINKLPYIVIIIDEFADLVMSFGKNIELLVVRLLQKARACGMHVILATQRPSVNVVTGLIKANIPSRIAFTVSSKIDSRTILDQIGAESLLGKGDMFYLPSDSSIPMRIHGAFISDEEISSVVKHWINIVT